MLAIGEERLLLIDTCGETAGVALSKGDQIIASEDLARGSASAEILSALSRLLAKTHLNLAHLSAAGVVHGPGSFTGIRAGLATAKGLCESLQLPLIAVSRLEVLADAVNLPRSVAALDAGRGELYLRDTDSGREWLASIQDLLADPDRRAVALAEPRLIHHLADRPTVLRPLHVADALPVVLRALRSGRPDAILADANYVREEQNIYPKFAALPKFTLESP